MGESTLIQSELLAARSEAEQALAAARGVSDPKALVAALTDLGAACTRGNEAIRAIGFFEEALTIVQPLNDPVLEADVRGNLALAHLANGVPPKAIAELNRSLELARATGNRVEEKMALYRLGNVWTALRDPIRAGTFYEQSLAVARAIGDRLHEAELNWQLAIINEDIGRHEQAVLRANATVAILRGLKHAHADWFADHVQQFVGGASRAGAASGANALATLTGALLPGAQLAEPPVAAEIAGPTFLQMAYSAAKSLTKFLGSGLRTVPAEARDGRLQICGTCEYHTGARCRVCGCFTSAKTWLPHERCPLGKW